MRRFMLNKKAILRGAVWLDRTSIYEGKLISMTARTVRLFAPDATADRKHVDMSYDWVVPMH